MDVMQIALSAIIGGSGMCGLIFFFMKRYIEKRLNEREAQEAQEAELRRRRRRVNDKIQHATGRTLFWIVKAIETGEHNGDLKKSFEDLQTAEEEGKELDREILAKHDET